MKPHFAAFALFASVISFSQAAIVITEFTYQGGNVAETEFIEFTNIGTTAIDMLDWSFSDSIGIAGTVSLSAFGVVQPGQSVILTDATEADFRALWTNVGSSVVIIGENTTGLGRNDTINLFDDNGILMDRLIYGDDINVPGSVRPRRAGFTTAPENYGNGLTDSEAILDWYASTTADGISSASTAGDIGSPGAAIVPEPSTLLLGLLGAVGGLSRRRRR